MAKRRIKTLKGYNAEVVVGNATNYTAQTTIADFETTAAEGEIGVVLLTGNSGTLLDGATPLTAGQRFYIIQKVDGLVRTTVPTVFDPEAARLVAYTAPVKQVWTLDTSAIVVTNRPEVTITVADVTPDTAIPQLWQYSYKAKVGETVTQLVARIAADMNNSSTNIVNIPDNSPVVATISSDDLVLTSRDFGTRFTASIQVYDPVLDGVQPITITKTTPYKEGNGTYDQVNAIEQEGIVYQGYANYPTQALPEDFGKPTTFASSALTYNTFHYDLLKDIFTPSVPSKMHFDYHLVIFAPSTGASATEELAITFGL